MKTRFLAIAVLFLAALGLVPAPTAAQGYGESPYIFGVHDPEGAGAISIRKGWILFTEELGRDPNNQGGRDYRPWADQGYGILVRLNHGYGPDPGGIPHSAHFGPFTQRVANFVRNSPGAHIWILGNEMNWDLQWPGYDGYREPTTPEIYVQLFRQVRTAIKGLPGHASDQVLPGPIGTYGPPVNAQGQYMCDMAQPGCYGYIEYHKKILDLLGPGGLDGIVIHTYTHGTSPGLISDEKRMDPPYAGRRYHFRAYRDYLDSHPSWARSLPAYITETDQVDPWADTNSGWVKNAYREINDWNQGAGNQKVRALCLYRFCCDQWNIAGKNGVVADLRDAQANDYRWTNASGGNCINTVAVDHWKGEYFPNINLTGSPTLVRDDGTQFLNMSWGDGGPGGCGIGTDNFSVRWTRTMFFNAGTYRFTAQADDGVRLYVDGALKIDQWRDQPPTAFNADVVLAAGNHAIKLEYYEHGYGAVAGLSWTFVSGGGGEPLDAEVVEGQSSVPSSLGPGETRQVVLRVKNTGTSTWTAADNVRLGAGPDNTMVWSAFSCGGYANSVADARSYLCSSVAPGATADFTFSVKAPASGTGTLSVRMVKELVAWFGENQKWSIPVASNPCLGGAPADHWKGEYFANTALSGSASLVRDDGAGDIAFDWGNGGPNTCGIGIDNYSVRWTKTATFNAGTYRFTARTDDGVRLYVDGSLVLDKWLVQAPTTYTADVSLAAGSHTVNVEYFEQGGGAVAQVSWALQGGGSACQQTAPADHWKGEYFASTSLGGAVAMTRDDGAGDLAFDWGGGGPNTCGIGADNFSVRWTKTATFSAGTYRFTTRTDDGVRLYVDNQLYIDKWIQQAPTVYTADVTLSAGSHVVKVEYLELAGGAVAQVSWQQTGGGSACNQAVPADRWKGEYWSNRDYSGSPAMVRDDGNAFLNFDWGSGSPSTACGVPADVFSARFTRTATFENATYRFAARADDGLRLYVDGALKLDQWRDQAPTTYTVDVPLSAGSHTIRFDYYENALGAVAALSWDKVTGGGGGTTSASKMSVHSGGGSLTMQFVRDAKPKLVKLLDNFGGAAEIKAASPGTIIIGRIYQADQPQDGDPGQRAQQWFDRHRDKILNNPLVDYWEGYNEPAAGSVDQVAWYGRMEEARVRILAQNGKKACIGNFSVGNPDVGNPAVWPAFYPAIDAARQNGGILGLHEYGTPMQQYFDGAAGEGWFCGRYRKVYRQFLIPSGRTLPLAVTETGVDVVAPTGWKNHFTGDQYMDQLKWYDSVMRQDSYVVGATIFTVDLGGWDSFDIAPIMGPLTDYVKNAR